MKGAFVDRITPVTLTGSWVVLEPLAIGHVEDLAAVGLDPDLWQWIPTPLATLADMRRYVEAALEEQARGVSLPFVQRDARTGAVIGSTRYGAIAEQMLRKALDAFVSQDIEIAQAVLREDDDLDALKQQVFRELLTYMLADQIGRAHV